MKEVGLVLVAIIGVVGLGNLNTIIARFVLRNFERYVVYSYSALIVALLVCSIIIVLGYERVSEWSISKRKLAAVKAEENRLDAERRKAEDVERENEKTRADLLIKRKVRNINHELLTHTHNLGKMDGTQMGMLLDNCISELHKIPGLQNYHFHDDAICSDVNVIMDRIQHSNYHDKGVIQRIRSAYRLSMEQK